MRPPRPMSPWAGFLLQVAAMVLGVSVLPIIVGCGGIVGGEPPKSAALLETETKVQALMKQGKSLTEIRAIMRGVPLARKGKKTARKH